MKTTWLIGRECKCGNAFSGPILIGRGLDQGRCENDALCGFEGAEKHRFKTKKQEKKFSGGNYEKDPPVPIPNTAVKLLSAENTRTETSREDRSSPDLYEPRIRIGYGVLL